MVWGIHRGINQYLRMRLTGRSAGGDGGSGNGGGDDRAEVMEMAAMAAVMEVAVMEAAMMW